MTHQKLTSHGLGSCVILYMGAKRYSHHNPPKLASHTIGSCVILYMGAKRTSPTTHQKLTSHGLGSCVIMDVDDDRRAPGNHATSRPLDIYQAKRKNMITVYSQPACMQCKATIRYLDKLDADYTVIDITVDDAARSHVMDDLGYTQAPVVETDDTHWSGYRPERIASAVTAA